MFMGERHHKASITQGIVTVTIQLFDRISQSVAVGDGCLALAVRTEDSHVSLSVGDSLS